MHRPYYIPELEAQINAAWESAKPEVLSALHAQEFVGHNISLSASEGTRAGMAFISESPRTVAIHEALTYFGPPDLMGRRALDLGCLEGGLSFELRRRGLQVTGVEGREENHKKCMLVAEFYESLGGMEFLLQDVRDFQVDPENRFDIVVCSGLLYHLDEPADFIGKLGGLTADAGMLYLDTHVAPHDSDMPDCAFRENLSELKSGDWQGIDIRYREYNEDVTLPESSIGNRHSVWMDVDSHIEALYKAGFDRVFQLHGHMGAGEQDLKRRYCRQAFVALRSIHRPKN